MFGFLHGYDPVLWRGYKENDLLGEHDGIRFVQDAFNPEGKDFNSVAAKGGELWKIIAEEKRPLYIDRLQGGLQIYDYDFDEELLEEYRNLLGDKFLGFQMHEWMSNYQSDLLKCADVAAEDWTAENISAAIYKAHPCKPILLESMKLDEFIAGGKVKSADEFYNHITAMYKKRVKKYRDLVACDSGYIMYPFEAENGANMIMPEIGGASYKGVILSMSFARAVTKAYGIKFGAYYEPWGGKPFSACMYQPDGRNEWFLDKASAFPYKTGGATGGSSRSNQWRIYLYSYLSGVEYISEEWGAYNTFCDPDCHTLSEYGEVKKRFIDFTRKYSDIGEKVAPIAVVLPNSLPTYVIAGYEESHTGDHPDTLYRFPVDAQRGEMLSKIKKGVNFIFRRASQMLGSETKGLINSLVPDAVDMLNEGDGKALNGYKYLVDLTCDPEFAKKHDNIILPEEVPEKLAQLLPCEVEGGLHYLLNKREDGRYYLTVFNHSGIVRTIEDGEYGLPEAAVTANITFKSEFADKTLTLLEGDGELEKIDGKYSITLPAGGFAFMEF